MLNGNRPIYLKITGARGENILDVVRRLGLGGAGPGSTDAETMLDYALYIQDNLPGGDLDELIALGAAIEASGAVVQNFESVTLAKLADVPDAVTFLRTAGYWAVGDGGGALYKKVDADPAKGRGAFQTHDNKWWLLSEAFPNVRQFGAKGNGADDDTTALKDAGTFGTSILVPNVATADAFFKLTDTVTLAAGTSWIGQGYLSRIKQTVTDKNCLVFGGDGCAAERLHLIGYGGFTGTDFSKNCGVFWAGKHKCRVNACVLEGFEACAIQWRGTADVSITDNLCFAGYWGGTPNPGFSPGADIMGYSGSGEVGRIIITGNFCLSRCSEGIAINELGGDSEVIVEGNICVTCNDDGSEFDYSGDLPPGELSIRRHGIQLSYNGAGVGGSPQRITCQGNICRNTAWSGIYANSDPGVSGPFQINGNFCSKFAQEDPGMGTPILGGICVFGGSNTDTTQIEGNFCIDSPFGPGVRFRMELTPTATGLITGNFIARTYHGITLELNSRNTVVAENFIRDVNAGTYDIYVQASAGTAADGGFDIHDNRIMRADAFTSISWDTQDGTNRSFIRDNWITGVNPATGASKIDNTGIVIVGGPVTVEGNRVENFRYGICYTTVLSGVGRWAGERWADDNDLVNCVNGIGVGSNSGDDMIPFSGNRFVSVTNKFQSDGNFQAGWEAEIKGSNIEVYGLNAAPAAGTWAIGDRQLNSAPAAAGYIGNVCTTAGAPGTWKTFGPISA